MYSAQSFTHTDTTNWSVHTHGINSTSRQRSASAQSPAFCLTCAKTGKKKQKNTHVPSVSHYVGTVRHFSGDISKDLSLLTLLTAPLECGALYRKKKCPSCLPFTHSQSFVMVITLHIMIRTYAASQWPTDVA